MYKCYFYQLDFDHFVEIVTNSKLEEQLRLEQRKCIHSKDGSNGKNSSKYSVFKQLNTIL